MNRKLTLAIFSAGCLLSVAALYLSFRNVPIADLMAYLERINYWWIFPTAAMVLVTFALRAYRWQIILKDASDVRYWQAFHPLMIGFMMNSILPGRIGELARPMILMKERGVALSTGVATVVAERILDMAALLALLAVSLGAITSQPDLSKTYFGMQLSSQTLVAAAWGVFRLGLALMAFIAIISFKPSRDMVIHAVVIIARYLAFGREGWKKKTQRGSEFIIRTIDNFAIGLSMVRKPSRLLPCLALTMLIWGITVLSYMVFAKGCPGIQLSLPEYATVLVVICFFIALPSAPGFWGLWEAAGVFALALFGVTEKDALGFTIVNHAINLFPVIAVGLISAFITSINVLRVAQTGRIIEEAEPNI